MGFFQKTLNSKGFERFRRKMLLWTKIYLRIKKLRPNVSAELRTVKLLKHKEIYTVLDIGANTGQFAEALIDFGFKERIISFEPVSSVHAKLSKRAKKYANWVAHPVCAVGETPGDTTINITADTVFSSVLKTDENHVKAKPSSRVVASETVKVITVKDIVSQYQLDPSKTMLKVDTQGFEKEVLTGAGELIGQFKGIKVEIPLFPIYENTSWTFDDIMDFLRSKGYRLYSIESEGVDAKTGRMNTADGIFFLE